MKYIVYVIIIVILFLSIVCINNLDTSQKDYFKGQVEIIDEILSDIKKRPIPFNPWLMPF